MKKKLENFLYYYKFHTIAVLLILVIVIILVKDSAGNKEVDFVLVDDTSALNMTTAKTLMQEFSDETGISSEFRYQTMYLQQEQFSDISFELAGIEEFEKCFSSGAIDMVITSADTIETTKMDGETEIRVYKQTHDVIMLQDYFSKEELEKYDKYIYRIGEDAVGIAFDKTEKGKKYFGDDYPTQYHYILQIASGCKNDEALKKFINFLLEE